MGLLDHGSPLQPTCLRQAGWVPGQEDGEGWGDLGDSGSRDQRPGAGALLPSLWGGGVRTLGTGLQREHDLGERRVQSVV